MAEIGVRHGQLRCVNALLARHSSRADPLAPLGHWLVPDWVPGVGTGRVESNAHAVGDHHANVQRRPRWCNWRDPAGMPWRWADWDRRGARRSRVQLSEHGSDDRVWTGLRRSRSRHWHVRWRATPTDASRPQRRVPSGVHDPGLARTASGSGRRSDDARPLPVREQASVLCGAFYGCSLTVRARTTRWTHRP